MCDCDACFLDSLSNSDSNRAISAAESIHVAAALKLPKETELFVSDPHGEYEALSHVLRSASGLVGERVDELFSDMSDRWRSELCALACYPSERLAASSGVSPADDALGGTYGLREEALFALASLAGSFARDRQLLDVVDLLPEDLACVMFEMMARADGNAQSDCAYREAACAEAAKRGQIECLIVAFAELVQHLAVGRLHVVGDVYDRGPAPDLIMDLLDAQPSLDIQWGNHDVVWMGAALGQRGCIAHVVRNCARYGNLSILEDAYGINLRPLASFAERAYADDPCVAFGLKGSPDLPDDELALAVKVQKAMAIIQFKVEGALIAEHPEYGLDDRRLLHRIDYAAGTVDLGGKVYELTDKVFPTIDPSDPYALTPEEEKAIESLERAFMGSEKLQRHMRVLLDRGGLYKVSNNMLMLHACVPLNADGSLMSAEVCGRTCKGRSLYDAMEEQVRAAFDGVDDDARKQGRDMLWYMWLGPSSPLFAKSKMATFELYLIAEKEARKEVKNPFYSLMDDAAAFDAIFSDFGMDPSVARMVCGHVPVKVKDGEDPVKCNGRVLAIDGGYSKAYQPTTGIAGFTLISDAHGLFLDAHEPFAGRRAAILDCAGMRSNRRVVESYDEAKTVGDTDAGKFEMSLVEEVPS